MNHSTWDLEVHAREMQRRRLHEADRARLIDFEVRHLPTLAEGDMPHATPKHFFRYLAWRLHHAPVAKFLTSTYE